ncbi:hypothetical protein [Massilia sp. Root133]|uniref:hypothetical protein n=1 Tax=Massilia sp. Root133 TaxID=1736455 RepID=UPI00138F1751|nr:hypothetical protein [Massilia sp. Root133]
MALIVVLFEMAGKSAAVSNVDTFAANPEGNGHYGVRGQEGMARLAGIEPTTLGFGGQ